MPAPHELPRAILVINRDSFFLSHRLPLALALKRRGFDVTILAEDTGFADQIRAARLNFIPLPITRRSMNPIKELGTLFFLFRTYRKIRPSIVHHVTPKPVFWGTLAARLLGNIPTINAIVGLGSSLNPQPKPYDISQCIIRFLYRSSLAHPHSRAIFMNRDDLEVFHRLRLIKNASSCVIIRGSGVDLDRFKSQARILGPLVVMFASRILVDKGFCEFTEASRILKIKNPGVRFVVVGDRDPGNPSSPTDEFFNSIVSDKTFEFWGYRTDMPEVLKHADMIVLPTYGEGLPKALLEAAACAKPIVTTDVSGSRECVIHEKTGLLVPAKNALRLADAIQRLLEDENARAEYGKAGRKLVEQEFSVEKVLLQTLKLYEDLLAGKISTVTK